MPLSDGVFRGGSERGGRSKVLEKEGMTKFGCAAGGAGGGGSDDEEGALGVGLVAVVDCGEDESGVGLLVDRIDE